MSDGRPRRTRQNLEGLLKFCVENTAIEDPTAQSSAVEIDPERKAWLAEALAAFTGDDEMSLMKKCLQILAAPEGKLLLDPEEDFMTRENALDQLESVVDVIDNARDFYKLGGFDILMNYMEDSSDTLKGKALAVLGLCLQNNTFCQDHALKMKILPKLLGMLVAEFSDSQVNVKATYALGCLIRGHDEAESLFIASDGFSLLLRALQRNIPKLNVKAIFLISNLTAEKHEYLETLYNMGMVEQLISIIQGPHDRHHEHVLDILLKLVSRCPAAAKDCRREKYALRNSLENRKKYLEETDPDAYEEEIGYCSEILKLCFPEDNLNDSTER